MWFNTFPQPTAPDDGEPPSGDMECLLMTGSSFGGFFDGTWTKSSDGDYYTITTGIGEVYLLYSNYDQGYAVKGEPTQAAARYMHCPNVGAVTECTEGKWVRSSGEVPEDGASVVMVACDATAFEMNSDSANGEGDTEDDGWKVVLVVVIVGLVLIAVGNIAFCVYMKRATVPKHNNR